MYDQLTRGSLALVAAPTVEPLSLEEAKHHLRVKLDVENDTVEDLIQAAREHLDGRDGWLGRAINTQTWDYTLQQFPVEGCIRLPLPPVQSIASVKYRDASGSLVTWASSNYTLSADLHWMPELRLAYGASWPAIRAQPDAVVIQTINGYGDTAEVVPKPIRQALLLLIGHWYLNREIMGDSTQPLPFGVEALLQPYLITSF